MDGRRFVELWRRAGSCRGGRRARAVFRRLEAFYGEPHRVYHTARHIDHCLREVDRIPDSFDGKDLVEMAIWFHDAIYRLGDQRNEADSAAWFAEQAEGDLPERSVAEVCEMILATRHVDGPRGLGACYVVDVDLCSFGLPWKEFAVDSRRVRAELTHLNDEEFLVASRGFLGGLELREHFFHTELFRGLYEAQARDNLRTRLALIDKSIC